jgi:uncharacterized protein YggL (DUF469 family)
METTLAKGIEYTYNRNEIDKKICNTIDFIKDVIKENDYQVSGDIEEFYLLEWKDFSKNQLKKIQKYCYWVEKNPSLKKINTFLNLLSKYFGVERVKVKISLKEEKIQKTRKEWLTARNEAERLLSIYKLEKGDFYKNKTNFFIKK